MSWDLRLLRAFVTLADHGHMRRAAAALYISQPALSKQIRQLEETWGVALFTRHPRGVSVTQDGEPLLAAARALLAGAADLDLAAAAAARAATSLLRIGFLGQALNEHTSPLVREFRRTHPQARLELRQYDMRDMSAGLRSGDSDLGILRGPSSARGLVHHEFLREPRVAVLSSDDPLARRRTLRLADLFDRPWVISANPDPAYQDFALATTARGARAPLRGPTVASIDEYLEAVLDGSAIGLAPRSASRYYTRPGVSYRRVIDAEPSVVHLRHRAGKGELPPLAAAFLALAIAQARTTLHSSSPRDGTPTTRSMTAETRRKAS